MKLNRIDYLLLGVVSVLLFHVAILLDLLAQLLTHQSGF